MIFEEILRCFVNLTIGRILFLFKQKIKLNTESNDFLTERKKS